MNLNGPADWNTELPFVDVFRFSREWISQQAGKPWGHGPKLDLDERGWVRRLAPGCFAETCLCTIEGGHYPGGEYVVLYDGEGKLDFGGAAALVSAEPGRVTVSVDPSKGGFFLRVRQTNPSNHVRNLRVLMPGFEASYQSNPFHPVFLKRWQGIACLRFMDWMLTNGSRLKTWAGRPRLDDATWTAKGVPVEVMVDLANRLNADAWFCMPHQATDDYVRGFAAAVKQRLAPGLKAYIEYSNEVWNGSFEQNHYAADKARELHLGPPERPWEGAALYYGRRSSEIFRIWEEVFGGTNRLVRVVAWQAASGSYWTDGLLLAQGDVARHADALAIAPYITMCVPPTSTDPKALTAPQVAGWTVGQVLDHLESKALPECLGWVAEHRKVAAKHRLQLIAYEAGQHMVGVAGGEDNEAMTKLFLAANAHPRIAGIYRRYLGAWKDAGGGLLCYFASTGAWSKWGSWGILQHYDDDPARSPKFMAAMTWASEQGQTVNVPAAR